VATDELQASIHGIQQQNPRWEPFEETLQTTFAVGDSSKATRRGFEDWVETPDKGLKVVDVFSAFETRFRSLSARDQALLSPNKVIMFLQAVDIQDQKDLGVLLEDTTTESGVVCLFTHDMKHMSGGRNQKSADRQWPEDLGL
jgi:hypothetical protein